MHDVISAFLDNEPFDPGELSASLATPDGRDLLLDLIALRAVVQPAEPMPVSAPARRRLFHWGVAAAAAVVMLASGYVVGRQSAPDPVGSQATTTIAAPEPTAVFKFEPGKNWTDSNQAGGN